jgi:hypothetical protein
MNKLYRYKIEGSNRDGQTFKTEGNILCKFEEAHISALRSGFKNLTCGRAIFGKPGVGCSGPYDIHSILIELVKQ